MLGGVASDQLLLNEKSIWTGRAEPEDPEDAASASPT